MCQNDRVFRWPPRRECYRIVNNRYLWIARLPGTITLVCGDTSPEREQPDAATPFRSGFILSNVM